MPDDHPLLSLPSSTCSCSAFSKLPLFYKQLPKRVGRDLCHQTAAIRDPTVHNVDRVFVLITVRYTAVELIIANLHAAGC
jgi:hypothetical protein